MDSWRAGCVETRTSGSAGGLGKRNACKGVNAPQSDPTHPRTARPPSPGVVAEPDDVDDLRHEQRVAGGLDPAGPVRPEAEVPPDPPDRRLRQAGPPRSDA